VPLQVGFFLQRFAKELGKSAKQVSNETMQLASYAWPGNIRELQNVIERAILLSPGDALQLAADFFPAPATTGFGVPALAGQAHELLTPTAAPNAQPAEAGTPNASLEDVECRHIESVLNQTNWMIEGECGAAKILNLNHSTRRSRMQKLGIKRPRTT
jgi:formate hydrogenlyase transcriptional activator